ncbi:hypothetical protein A9G35_06670 [Gilliamella sp. Choc5-1]|uniref:hypothetical protein n=1 Tax=Gilliamella sp. Choc5-1 TaxID=3120238 RepID=UPI00080DCCF8|nr:hypothetical protein [Gilliamella apicola]OCG45310.1 hypothetical protein A9G35_06670 [Gilliamella apicola]
MPADFDGPLDIWSHDKGYLVQSIDPKSYNLNFPTTGMNGLYFDLLIEGVDASKLIWEPVTHEGITATMKYVRADDSWLHLQPEYRKKVTRVKLTGPQAINQFDSANPSRIRIPKLPQTFELVGRDNRGNEVVKYGFVLQKWFVVRDSNYRIRRINQQIWCDKLGYQLPQGKDLTNAICFNAHGFDITWCRDFVGATPPSSANNYQRRIGGGLFSEWVTLSNYAIVERYIDYDCHPTRDFNHQGYPYQGARYHVCQRWGNIGGANDEYDEQVFGATVFSGVVSGIYGRINHGFCVTP